MYWKHPRSAIRQAHRNLPQRVRLTPHDPHADAPRGCATPGRRAGAERCCSRRAARGPKYCNAIIPINSPNSPVNGRRSPLRSRAYTTPNAATHKTFRGHQRALHPTRTLTSDPHRAPPPDARGAAHDAPTPAARHPTPAPHKSAPAPAPRSRNERITHRPPRTRSRHPRRSKARGRELPLDAPRRPRRSAATRHASRLPNSS